MKLTSVAERKSKFKIQILFCLLQKLSRDLSRRRTKRKNNQAPGPKDWKKGSLVNHLASCLAAIMFSQQKPIHENRLMYGALIQCLRVGL